MKKNIWEEAQRERVEDFRVRSYSVPQAHKTDRQHRLLGGVALLCAIGIIGFVVLAIALALAH